MRDDPFAAGRDPHNDVEYAEWQRRGMQNWTLARMDIIEYVLMAPHSMHDMHPTGAVILYPTACGC